MSGPRSPIKSLFPPGPHHSRCLPLRHTTLRHHGNRPQSRRRSNRRPGPRRIGRFAHGAGPRRWAVDDRGPSDRSARAVGRGGRRRDRRRLRAPAVCPASAVGAGDPSGDVARARVGRAGVGVLSAVVRGCFLAPRARQGRHAVPWSRQLRAGGVQENEPEPDEEFERPAGGAPPTGNRVVADVAGGRGRSGGVDIPQASDRRAPGLRNRAGETARQESRRRLPDRQRGGHVVPRRRGQQGTHGAALTARRDGEEVQGEPGRTSHPSRHRQQSRQNARHPRQPGGGHAARPVDGAPLLGAARPQRRQP